MSETVPGARKRRLIRSIQWRIIVCQVPLIFILLAAVLYWLEGHMERSVLDSSLRLGRQSALLAASAVRHSMVSESEPPSWDRIARDLPIDRDTRIEIVSLEGEVIYATDPDLRGRTYSRYTDSPCVSCHVAGSPRKTADTTIVSEPEETYYRIFAASLSNGPDCLSCHRGDGPKLGMAYVRQPLGPARRLIRTARLSLLIAGIAALGLTALAIRTLPGRFLSRSKPRPAALPKSMGAVGPAPHGNPGGNPASAAPPDTPDTSAERLRNSLHQIEQQRDELSTLYYITDQLSRSMQPDLICRRAVELASSVFGSVCVLVAGHFHPDSHIFHGTITYHRPGGDIVECPFPDDEVRKSAPFYNATIVERWLRGELDGVIRIREESTVAYPLERHGRRLGLLFAPARGRHESPDGRPTAAHPEVVQVARKHLAVALELSELQRERLQQERLAAIGQTVAGLSHCMKNTLNGLKGGKFVIERAVTTDNPEKLRKGLSVLTTAIRHIERLTLDMLFYAGEKSLDLKPGNPNETMREVVDLLEDNARGKGIDLKAELDARVEPILMDRHAIYRAILNLVTNAIDACVESETGKSVILRSSLQPDYTLLTVEDNGVGIPEHILRRVTERFFTTKSSEGTGLGLPVVQKIAQQHGGTLEVESVWGKGSAFHIRIPNAGHSPEAGSTGADS